LSRCTASAFRRSLSENLPGRYNICPTDTIDAVVERDGKRDLVPMRWGLVPWWWWKKKAKETLATFNARADTVASKPMFRDAFKRKRAGLGLLRVASYADRQAALLLHGTR
jgi:putative SOS response-associated peptidase YedK